VKQIKETDKRNGGREYCYMDTVGGESLEGVKMGVCPRRPGLA